MQELGRENQSLQVSWPRSSWSWQNGLITSLSVTVVVNACRSNSRKVWPESGRRITKFRTAWPVGKASPWLSERWGPVIALPQRELLVFYIQCLYFTSFPIWNYSTTVDTAGTSSAASVRRGTPSRRPLRSPYGFARRVLKSSRADFLFSPAPQLLPFNPFYSNGQKKARLCHFQCALMKDRPSATTSICIDLLALIGRRRHGDAVGSAGTVCICFCAFRCYCGLPERGDGDGESSLTSTSSCSGLHLCSASSVLRWLFWSLLMLVTVSLNGCMNWQWSSVQFCHTKVNASNYFIICI